MTCYGITLTTAIDVGTERCARESMGIIFPQMRGMVVKIANPSTLDSKEHYDETNHLIEDTLSSFMKILRIENKDVTTEDCIVNVNLDEKAINMDFTRFFDLELSNSKHDKARKLLENTSANMMSRHALKMRAMM